MRNAFWLACGLIVAIGAYLLLFRSSVNPILLVMLLICPLLHLFMHRGHHQGHVQQGNEASASDDNQTSCH